MKLRVILGGVAGGLTVLYLQSLFAPDYEAYLSPLQKNLRRIHEEKKNVFIIDRILDGDCLGKPLFVGVHKEPNEHQPLSAQGIRLGETGEIKKLISFQKTNNSRLEYHFEDNVCLTIQNDAYTYKTPICDVSGKPRTYKPIGMSVSAELDEIGKLL